jgi:hypothetical protein
VRSSVVYTYDFPGNPGSGLAADQTNPQFANATFSDWTRVNVSAGPAANSFDSIFWNTTSSFDSTQYASFSITADAGYHLNLSLLTFDEMRTSGGPTKGHVEMFLDGSAAPYDVMNYNPHASFHSEAFSFTPTTDADNVGTVEFRFYGWNGGTPEASLIFANVAVTLSIVPEPGTLMFALLPVGITLYSLARGWRRKKQAPIGRNRF